MIRSSLNPETNGNEFSVITWKMRLIFASPRNRLSMPIRIYEIFRFHPEWLRAHTRAQRKIITHGKDKRLQTIIVASCPMTSVTHFISTIVTLHHNNCHSLANVGCQKLWNSHLKSSLWLKIVGEINPFNVAQRQQNTTKTLPLSETIRICLYK